jgi:small subunit ribosomal protein S16
LIKKYGTNGSHLEIQKEATERLSKRKEYSPVPAPVTPTKKKEAEPKAEEEPKAEAEPAAEEAAAEPAAEDAAAEETASE